jgi:hypothetical protein
MNGFEFYQRECERRLATRRRPFVWSSGDTIGLVIIPGRLEGRPEELARSRNTSDLERRRRRARSLGVQV